MTRREFIARFNQKFFDPAFDPVRDELKRIADIAWDGYKEGRKAPRTRRAGPRFADPDYQLSVDWLAARSAIHKAQREHDSPRSRRRVLLVIGSPRNDQTCPGEISKTYRMAGVARRAIEAARCECDVLDLSVLTSEYGRVIYPCKSCVSTAMPLCHWPCSCYPNHALAQTNDWMNEIYPRWVRAHGVMIVTPVHWLHAPSPLKLMMDRLVCADGGNPDPTTTQGKNPSLAKRLELNGWHYPRHLAGRAFAVIVHGDTEGHESLRRGLVDWLVAMELVQAGASGVLDRTVGYYEPYATSHLALDKDRALQQEIRNAARSLVEAIRMRTKGRREPGDRLRQPRPK